MAYRRTAYHFFLSNAGYSYDAKVETKLQGRIRGAQALARAERWAKEENLEYDWVFDEGCTADQFEFQEDIDHVNEHGGVGCILYRPCAQCAERVVKERCKHDEVLGSLWGITESLDNRQRDNYRRVVEAELALEAMPNV